MRTGLHRATPRLRAALWLLVCAVLVAFAEPAQAEGLLARRELDPQKLERVKKEFLDEINKLANEGLTAVELQRAKKKLIGQQEIANQSNDAFGYHCALDELYGLGFDYYKQLEHSVNAVTLDDIKKVAAKYFRDQPYVLATVRPPEGSAAAKQK